MLSHLLVQLKSHYKELQRESRLKSTSINSEEKSKSISLPEYLEFLEENFPQVQFLMLIDCGAEMKFPIWAQDIERLYRNSHFILTAPSNSALATISFKQNLPNEEKYIVHNLIQCFSFH